MENTIKKTRKYNENPAFSGVENNLFLAIFHKKNLSYFIQKNLSYNEYRRKIIKKVKEKWQWKNYYLERLIMKSIFPMTD